MIELSSEAAVYRTQTKTPAPLFSSQRERRLWIWTLTVVVAIYSTLGLASTLAGLLPERGLIVAVPFLFGMFLVGLTVLTQGLKLRPGGAEIAVALGIGAAYFMMCFRMTSPERSHIFEYGVVAVFIYEALMERATQGRRVRLPALLTILAATLIGLFDEWIQLFIPSRVFDPLDILFNFLAAVMAVTASAALAWARRLRERRKTD